MSQELAESPIRSNPTDVSIEAVLELAEMQEGLREDAPALSELFNLLRAPTPSFNGVCGLSMLADVRTYTIFRDSLKQADPQVGIRDYREFQTVIEKFFKTLEDGVKSADPKCVEVAKRFCSAINSNFLARQMNDIYARRERSDARYISHESAS